MDNPRSDNTESKVVNIASQGPLDSMKRLNGPRTGPAAPQDATLVELILTHPFVTGATTIVGVLAGYLGAHFDKDIAASFLKLWFFDGMKLDAGATSFWIALLGFGFLFAYSGAAQARRADRFSTRLASISSAIDSKTDALRERAEEIDDRVRLLYTLPPPGFLEEYRDAVLNATQSLFFTLPDCKLPYGSRDLTIRVQLVNILALAREFDSDGKKARYGCNIMLFRRSVDMSDTDAAGYEGMLRFADRATSVKKLYGVLELQPELSVSSDSMSAEPDTKLTPFCLPVPGSSLVISDCFTVDVLPGAVDAFASKKAAVIETPEDWLERCKSGAFGGQERHGGIL
jgi:hypothetical protein